MFSEELGEKIAYNDFTCEVVTEGRVRYTDKEIKLLSEHGGIKKSVHMVKKIFGGTIVQ